MYNFKKLICTVIAAAFAVTSLCSTGVVFANTLTPSSDYYTIDTANKTVEGVLYNTFVGDFLKRIDVKGFSKKVVKDGSLVEAGFVDETMKLMIGNDEYSISLNAATLYDLQSLIESNGVAQGATYTYTHGTSSSIDIQSADGISSLFDYVSAPAGGTKSGVVATVTVKQDTKGKYIEFSSNSNYPLWFVTPMLEDYRSPSFANKNLEGYIVTEMEDVSLNQINGVFGTGHYWQNNSDAVVNPSGYFSQNSDTVWFLNSGFFGMGGNEKTNKAASNFAYLNTKRDDGAAAYSAATPAKVEQFVKIEDANELDNTEKGYKITAPNLYLDGKAFTGKQSKALDILVKEAKENTRIGKGMLGVGGNGVNGVNTTTVTLKNYRIYISENLPGAVTTANAVQFTTVTSTISDLGIGAKAITNIPVGTTVEELINSLSIPENYYVYIHNGDFNPYPQNKVVKTGDRLMFTKTYENTEGEIAKSQRTITLTTASEDPVVDGLGTSTITASRRISSLANGIIAAYDDDGRIVGIFKTNTAVIDNTSGNIKSLKFFLFGNLNSLNPLVEVKEIK